jgi:hypothetical protein
LPIALLFDRLFGMRQRAAWWWNGRWGRLARRDIKIYSDDASWSLDDVRGGVEGRVRTVADLDEARAMAMARDLMASGDEWRDMLAG